VSFFENVRDVRISLTFAQSDPDSTQRAGIARRFRGCPIQLGGLRAISLLSIYCREVDTRRGEGRQPYQGLIELPRRSFFLPLLFVNYAECVRQKSGSRKLRKTLLELLLSIDPIALFDERKNRPQVALFVL
jgi:hypothetical protein